MTQANSEDFGRSECRKAPEFFKAGEDFTSIKSSEALDAELLAAEAAHNGAIDYRSMKVVHIDLSVSKIESAFGKIPDEPSRKTVACARRIENILQQVTGNPKQGIVPEEHGAVFASLDHEGAGSKIQNR